MVFKNLNQDEGNPRKGDIDTTWWPVRDDLQKGNGRAVSDTLAHLRETDRPLWNAIYWRVNGWLAGRLSLFPMNDSEAKTYGDDRLALGRDRLAAFVRYLYPQRIPGGQWHGEDLPYIVQEMQAIKERRAAS